jgi:glycosyltransferase involved in cell wall biosynthesis
MSRRPGPDAVVFVRSLLTAFGGAEHAAALNAVGMRRRGYAVTFLAGSPMDTSHPYYRMLVSAGVTVLTPTPWTERTVLRSVALALRPVAILPYLLLRPKPIGAAWSSVAEIVKTVLRRLEERSVLAILERVRRRARSLIVHVYGQEGLTPLIAAWGTAAAVPVVYTETGEADETYVARFNLKWTIDSIDAIPLVICCGPRVAANIRRVYGYRGAIEEIPFLIEDPEPRPPDPLSAHDVTVGMVGRLVEHKGHRDAIAAIAQLRREGLPVTLIVGGDGPMLDPLRAAADELGVLDCVRFTGRFEHVGDILSRIDLFVLPSSSEAQPLAITEAMAYGKPVVSTWFGGIPDLIAHGRTGLLVEPGNRSELIDALRCLCADADLRRRMGQAARADYLEARSNGAVLGRIEQAYRFAQRASAPLMAAL